MANQEWNDIDKFTPPNEQFYCAFLDILGYKDKSEKYFAGKYNLHARFERALNHATLLHDLTGLFVDTSKIKIKFFSDSIILSTPCNVENQDGIYGIVQMCKTLSAHLSFESLWVRGGISIGSHIECDEKNLRYSFISSIALQQAYLLESKQAKTPRILIDEKIINQLPEQLKPYIAKEDQDHFIHFAPQLINQNGENQDAVLQEMIEIYTELNTQVDDGVKAKYQWILDYYYWTLSTSENINMDMFSQFKRDVAHRFSLLQTRNS